MNISSVLTPADLETDLEGDPLKLEAQNEPQEILEAQNEPLNPDLEAQNEPPTYVPEVPVRTHSTRARDGRSDRIHSPEAPSDPPQRTGEFRLLGAVPLPRCAHPHAHAWCDGRVHVPKGLHFEFLDQLDTRPGESRQAKAGRLIAFYASVDATLPADEPIGENPFKFWRRRFEAAFASQPATRQNSRDTWRRAVGAAADVSDEDRAARAAIQTARLAADDAALEEATRVYDNLTPDARAEIERQAREDLKNFEPNSWDPTEVHDIFRTSVRNRVIQIIKSDAGVGQRRNPERKQG